MAFEKIIIIYNKLSLFHRGSKLCKFTNLVFIFKILIKILKVGGTLFSRKRGGGTFNEFIEKSLMTDDKGTKLPNRICLLITWRLNKFIKNSNVGSNIY